MTSQPLYKSIISNTLPTDGAVPTTLHISKDHIIIALSDGLVLVFDHTGNNAQKINLEKTIWSIATGADSHSKWFVAGGTDGFLQVWDVDRFEVRVGLVGHKGSVRAVGILEYGEKIVSASRDTTLRVWDVQSGNCLAVLEGHRDTVRSLAVEGTVVVSGSYDGEARVWDLKRLERLDGRDEMKLEAKLVLKGHEKAIYAVVMGGKKVVTGSLDATSRVWDVDTGGCLAVLEGHATLVSRLKLLPNNMLVTGDAGGFIRVWSMKDYAELRNIASHENAVSAMQSDGDGKRIVTAGTDGKIRVWDVGTGKMMVELMRGSDAAWNVDILDTGKIVALHGGEADVIFEMWERLS